MCYMYNYLYEDLQILDYVDIYFIFFRKKWTEHEVNRMFFISSTKAIPMDTKGSDTRSAMEESSQNDMTGKEVRSDLSERGE